ncbi:MAG TPA: glycosyltransferase family 1 protein [Anaerolineae bacterium]|nr:glycosyltransferase family 1 protein [Anaerolineae bacterium]
MQIGFDSTPLLGQRSGVGQYTNCLLTHLSQSRPDWQFDLYSNRPLNGALNDSLNGGRPNAQQIDGHFPRSRLYWMHMVLPGVIRKNRPDLCHFPNNSAPLHCPAPYVITIHDVSLFRYSQYHPRSRLLALRLLLPVVARRAAAVITVSRHARQELIHVLKIPPDKIHVIHEAPPTHIRPVTDPAALARIQRKYRLPRQFILYVGTIEPRKNLRRLVRAVGQLHQNGRHPHLILVGPNGWLMNGSLEKEIEQCGLTNYVRYLGYVPQADLAGIYSQATLFAFPSLYEGFGLPPLEAMACGLPVLTSRASSMAEVCQSAAYLVDPQDESDIAAGLDRLLTQPTLRADLRQKGLHRVQSFSWQRVAAETAVVYQKVLEHDE